jgi:hypothetical protein
MTILQLVQLVEQYPVTTGVITTITLALIIGIYTLTIRLLDSRKRG